MHLAECNCSDLNFLENKTLMSVQTSQFSNLTQHMSHSAHGHPSSFQGEKGNKTLALELDVEKRLQAFVAKDGVRIKEFFIDFDKLRKGTCGEAAVSYNAYNRLVPHLPRHPPDSPYPG